MTAGTSRAKWRWLLHSLNSLFGPDSQVPPISLFGGQFLPPPPRGRRLARKCHDFGGSRCPGLTKGERGPSRRWRRSVAATTTSSGLQIHPGLRRTRCSSKRCSSALLVVEMSRLLFVIIALAPNQEISKIKSLKLQHHLVLQSAASVGPGPAVPSTSHKQLRLATHQEELSDIAAGPAQ